MLSKRFIVLLGDNAVVIVALVLISSKTSHRELFMLHHEYSPRKIFCKDSLVIN